MPVKSFFYFAMDGWVEHLSIMQNRKELGWYTGQKRQACGHACNGMSMAERDTARRGMYRVLCRKDKGFGIQPRQIVEAQAREYGVGEAPLRREGGGGGGCRGWGGRGEVVGAALDQAFCSHLAGQSLEVMGMASPIGVFTVVPALRPSMSAEHGRQGRQSEEGPRLLALRQPAPASHMPHRCTAGCGLGEGPRLTVEHGLAHRRGSGRQVDARHRACSRAGAAGWLWALLCVACFGPAGGERASGPGGAPSKTRITVEFLQLSLAM